MSINKKLKKYTKTEENRNMLDEWESKLNNYTTEAMEEKRKTIDKTRKTRRKIDEIILEERKNDDDKENSLLGAVNSINNIKKGRKLLKKGNKQKKSNNDFIDYEDEEEDEDDDDFEKDIEENMMDLEESGAARLQKQIITIDSSKERLKRNLGKKNYFMDIEDEEEIE